MAKCNRCGKETELYEGGIPICPACIDERERPHGTEKPKGRPNCPPSRQRDL